MCAVEVDGVAREREAPKLATDQQQQQEHETAAAVSPCPDKATASAAEAQAVAQEGNRTRGALTVDTMLDDKRCVLLTSFARFFCSSCLAFD